MPVASAMPYYVLSLSVAVCSGLTVGVIRDNTIFGGMKDVVVLATAAFLVYDGYAATMIRRAGSRAEPMRLPVTVVAVAGETAAGGVATPSGGTIDPGLIGDIARLAGVRSVAAGRLDDVLTSLGSQSRLILGPSGRAMVEALQPTPGNLPVAADRVLAPRALAPRAVGGSASAMATDPGSPTLVAYPAAEVFRAPPQGSSLTISGWYDRFWDLGDPLITLDRIEPAQPNVLFVDASPEAVAAVRAAAEAAGLRAFSSDWPREMVRTLTSANYRPGGEAVLLLFVIIAIGGWTLFLLGFLERRRELAVLKAVGLSSGEISRVFFGEAALTGCAGAGLGIALGQILLLAMHRMTALPLTASLGGVVAGTISAFAVAAAAAVYPTALAGRATVVQLVNNQAIPLFYQRVESQGRD